MNNRWSAMDKGGMQRTIAGMQKVLGDML